MNKFFSNVTKLSIPLFLTNTTYCKKFYTQEDLNKNNGQNGNPYWISVKNKIYDITDFIKIHPGGDFIKLAAGSSVEPFWNKWPIHYNNSNVDLILKTNEIGFLSDYKEVILPDLFDNEPIRENNFNIFTIKPFNCETKPELLIKNQITPIEYLYIRNHSIVPDISEKSIILIGTKNGDLEINLENIKTFDIVSVLQCAGNRQIDNFNVNGKNLFSDGPFKYSNNGEMGNIKWSGYCLKELLNKYYPEVIQEENSVKEEKWHVIFTGYDDYVSSIPLKIILSSPSIIANKANDKYLTQDHGYPLRLIVPGIIGARNVKWIESIELSKKSSNMPWNRHYYNDENNNNLMKLPIQSIILKHEIIDDKILIQGVAYNSSAEIKKVEVYDGKSWHIADIEASLGHYSWRRWKILLKNNSDKYYSKATDIFGNSQPEKSDKNNGYIYNGYSLLEL